MGCSLIATPLSIRIAYKFNIIDTPHDSRRLHTHPVPRFGGFGIFVGANAALIVPAQVNHRIAIALIGGLLMYLLGVLDDIKDLRPIVKFAGQLAIASFVYALGIRITFITNFFDGSFARSDANIILSNGLAYVITVLWIVGVTNAVNLMDGLDGLAAGSVAIMTLTLAYVAYIHGNRYGMIVVAIALVGVAGACCGFLPYNFSPAKTFMGDGGSLFLGYMISVLSVISPLKKATFVGAIIPILVLAVPIFDTFAAMVRRTLRHQSIMKADREHLHHHLMAAGFGQRRSVLVMYGIVGIMGIVAVLISRELYKDAFFLFLIACLYLGIILVPKQPHEKYEARQEYMRQRRAEISAAKAAHADQQAAVSRDEDAKAAEQSK